MKRAILFITAMMMVVAIFTGCQKTPESPIVVGKNRDKMIEQAKAAEAARVYQQLKDELNEAMSAYYMILAAAAVSSVPVHAAVLMMNNGAVFKSEVFDHRDAQ